MLPLISFPYQTIQNSLSNIVVVVNRNVKDALLKKNPMAHIGVAMYLFQSRGIIVLAERFCSTAKQEWHLYGRVTRYLFSRLHINFATQLLTTYCLHILFIVQELSKGVGLVVRPSYTNSRGQGSIPPPSVPHSPRLGQTMHLKSHTEKGNVMV